MIPSATSSRSSSGGGLQLRRRQRRRDGDGPRRGRGNAARHQRHEDAGQGRPLAPGEPPGAAAGHVRHHAHRLRGHGVGGGLPAPRRGGLPAQAAQAHRPHPRHRAGPGQAPHRPGPQALPAEAGAQGARPHAELRTALRDIANTYQNTLLALVAALDAREHETSDHSQRVVSYTSHIATRMGLGGKELEEIARGALLHDIGKIGVPTRCCSSRASSPRRSGWRCASIRTSASR